MKTWAALGFVFAGMVACGGAVIDPLQDGGNGNDSGPGPGSDAGSPYCPSTQPAEGSSCSVEQMFCEYGNDPNMQCNVIAQCSLGHWTVMKPGGQCPTPPNPSACPATFASVPVGQHCGTLVGTTCDYPQGFCGCAVPQMGPYPEDASAVAIWTCDSPEPGCPMPRPKLGTSCTQEGLQCDYSPCSLPTGASLVCQSGAWQEQQYGCAL
jgi:hypothetical protein